MRKLIIWSLVSGLGVTALALVPVVTSAEQTQGALEYLVVATKKTSTAEEELNEAAAQGYRFVGVMGGETSFGGSEVVALMKRDPASQARYAYKLLATNRTSTMQKEMQEAADDGFEYKGQTVFESFFGGEEVVAIMERDTGAPIVAYEYLLLATNKTGTLQNELSEAGAGGYDFVGLTVGSTALGGKELVVITRRPR